MKYHVQFLAVGLYGELGEACGSDGVFILDGRNKLDTMIEDAHKRMQELSKVRSFIGFRIYKGQRFGEGREMLYARTYANGGNVHV